LKLYANVYNLKLYANVYNLNHCIPQVSGYCPNNVCAFLAPQNKVTIMAFTINLHFQLVPKI